jgi:apolipoprotein N-acyltransferase
MIAVRAPEPRRVVSVVVGVAGVVGVVVISFLLFSISGALALMTKEWGRWAPGTVGRCADGAVELHVRRSVDIGVGAPGRRGVAIQDSRGLNGSSLLGSVVGVSA